MNPSQPRCGRIDYANDLPIYAAFDAHAVPFPAGVRADVPAALNRALLAGDLDCSPISSFFYAQHADRLVLIPGVCIGSHREVRSIFYVSPSPPQQLDDAPVAVTKESATGRALFETICRTRYGFSPNLVAADDPFASYREGGACLLIGDKAIDASLAAPADDVYDLGLLWYEHARAPMVYAVWAARREYVTREPNAVAQIGSALRSALAWGRAHRLEVIERAQAAKPRPAGFYEGYYRSLKFDFDAEAQAGLRRFYDAAAACGVLRTAPALEFFGEELQRV